MEKIQAYWFATSDTLPNGDGRKVVIGETHSLKGGKIVICERGLHGSVHPFDALQYAPGCLLYRTEHWGSIVRESDKIASRHRRYVAMIDATDLLRQFAREQALSVIHLWDAPDVVRRYLEAGDESLRDAARAAVWAAACWAAAGADAWAKAAIAAAFWAAAGAEATKDITWAAARAAADRAAARAAARHRFAALINEAFKLTEALAVRQAAAHESAAAP